jgi:hypothetical protein
MTVPANSQVTQKHKTATQNSDYSKIFLLWGMEFIFDAG